MSGRHPFVPDLDYAMRYVCGLVIGERDGPFGPTPRHCDKPEDDPIHAMPAEDDQ